MRDPNDKIQIIPKVNTHIENLVLELEAVDEHEHLEVATLVPQTRIVPGSGRQAFSSHRRGRYVLSASALVGLGGVSRRSAS